MECTHCNGEHVAKRGKDRSGNQRFFCTDCKKSFLAPQVKPLGSMRVDLDKAAFALGLLLEGMSIRATERMTGLNRDTLCDLVAQAGANCQKFMEGMIQHQAVEFVEVDEQWSFVACKQKTAERLGHGPEVGDCYTFTAMDRNTKLMLCYHVGKRTPDDTADFIGKLRGCIAGKTMISSDGYTPYVSTIPHFFAGSDYGQIVKDFGTPGKEDQRRYSPATIIRVDRKVVCGEPSNWDIGTSRMERFNLSTRMHNRRFTRLTNAHSKKWENHEAMLGLYFAWYNWCRKHLTIKTTPAVASGLATEPWSLVRLLTEAAA